MSAATADDDDVLSIEIGGRTVGANLEAAIADGRVIRRQDGKFELPARQRQPHLETKGEFSPHCGFLNRFMFTQVYGAKAVPFGCRDCYKVKVTSTTLRDLMAVHKISETFPGRAKSGAEVGNQQNQSLYGTYFYLLGLDKARALYHKLRGKIDADPKLRAAVKMVIKRGCTNYELACGPSDRYTFDPRLAEIERYFWSRFVKKKSVPDIEEKYDGAIRLMLMVRTAYQIGDDTYKDFTGGKDLFRPTVTYDPGDRSDACYPAPSSG
jgi:hypothetical protein